MNNLNIYFFTDDLSLFNRLPQNYFHIQFGNDNKNNPL